MIILHYALVLKIDKIAFISLHITFNRPIHMLKLDACRIFLISIISMILKKKTPNACH